MDLNNKHACKKRVRKRRQQFNITLIISCIATVLFVVIFAISFSTTKPVVDNTESEILSYIVKPYCKIGDKVIADVEFNYLYYDLIYEDYPDYLIQSTTIVEEELPAAELEDYKKKTLEKFSLLYAIKDYFQPKCNNQNLESINEYKKDFIKTLDRTAKLNHMEPKEFLKLHYGKPINLDDLENIAELKAYYTLFNETILDKLSYDINSEEYIEYYKNNLNFLNSITGCSAVYSFSSDEEREEALKYAQSMYDISNNYDAFLNLFSEQALKIEEDKSKVSYEGIVYNNQLIYFTLNHPVIYQWLMNIDVNTTDKLAAILEDKEAQKIYVICLRDINFKDVYTTNCALIIFDEYSEAEQKKLNKQLNSRASLNFSDIKAIANEYNNIQEVKYIENMNPFTDISDLEQIEKFINTDIGNGVICYYKNNNSILYKISDGDNIILSMYLKEQYQIIMQDITENYIPLYSKVSFING